MDEDDEKQYVTLVSSDEHVFHISRKCAMVSGTIKSMLSGPGQFSENETNSINFREISSHVLEQVCKYFHYKIKYTAATVEIPDFPIEPAAALDLLMAANFLDT
eukprot:CFRG7920T1